MAREVIVPTNVHKPAGYSHAFKCGKTIYVAGQGAFTKDLWTVEPVGDFAGQLDQTFKNMQNVLAAAGATMDDVVKLTWFVVGKHDDDPRVGEVFAKYFKKPFPCGTTVGTTGCYHPDQLCEIDAIAVID